MFTVSPPPMSHKATPRFRIRNVGFSPLLTRCLTHFHFNPLPNVENILPNDEIRRIQNLRLIFFLLPKGVYQIQNRIFSKRVLRWPHLWSVVKCCLDTSNDENFVCDHPSRGHIVRLASVGNFPIGTRFQVRARTNFPFIPSSLKSSDWLNCQNDRKRNEMSDIDVMATRFAPLFRLLF